MITWMWSGIYGTWCVDDERAELALFRIVLLWLLFVLFCSINIHFCTDLI